MAVSKAQQKAVNKYMAANYDRINLTVAKGQRDTIKAHAESQGQSVNAYINAAIDARMAQESSGEVVVVSLPSLTIKATQEAAEAAGETVPKFVERAVEQRIKRDSKGGEQDAD